MNPEEIFKVIHAYCEANANEAIVQKYARYFKEGYDAFGLTQEQNAAFVNTLLEDPANDLAMVFRTAPLLLSMEGATRTGRALTPEMEEFRTPPYIPVCNGENDGRPETELPEKQGIITKIPQSTYKPPPSRRGQGEVNNERR